MGQIWRKEIEGREYSLVARSWSNSRAWGHECALFAGGYEEEHYRIRYYNRTWECYCSQSVIKGCLGKYVEGMEKRAEDIFRDKFNVKRFTKKVRESFSEWFKGLDMYPIYKGLKEWYEEL